MKRSLMIILLLMAALVGAAGCGGGSEGSTTAPSFSGTTRDGQQVSLESYRGKPLLLVFWASW